MRDAIGTRAHTFHTVSSRWVVKVEECVGGGCCGSKFVVEVGVREPLRSLVVSGSVREYEALPKLRDCVGVKSVVGGIRPVRSTSEEYSL